MQRADLLLLPGSLYSHKLRYFCNQRTKYSPTQLLINTWTGNVNEQKNVWKSFSHVTILQYLERSETTRHSQPLYSTTPWKWVKVCTRGRHSQTFHPSWGFGLLQKVGKLFFYHRSTKSRSYFFVFSQTNWRCTSHNWKELPNKQRTSGTQKKESFQDNCSEVGTLVYKQAENICLCKNQENVANNMFVLLSCPWKMLQPCAASFTFSYISPSGTKPASVSERRAGNLHIVIW